MVVIFYIDRLLYHYYVVYVYFFFQFFHSSLFSIRDFLLANFSLLLKSHKEISTKNYKNIFQHHLEVFHVIHVTNNVYVTGKVYNLGNIDNRWYDLMKYDKSMNNVM
jgi:hypothetical protein